MQQIDIIIADDQPLIRDGLEVILNSQQNYRVIAKTETGEETLEVVIQKQPQLVLMDVNMPGMGGLEATRLIKERFPTVQVLMLTTFSDNEYIWEALKYGADGYLLKGMETERILRAISECLAGQFQVPASIQSELMAKARNVASKETLTSRPESIDYNLLDSLFTPREKETIQLLIEGKTNDEIAEALFLSTGTIKNRLSTIFKKINVRHRAEAIAKINEMIRSGNHF